MCAQPLTHAQLRAVLFNLFSLAEPLDNVLVSQGTPNSNYMGYVAHKRGQIVYIRGFYFGETVLASFFSQAMHKVDTSFFQQPV